MSLMPDFAAARSGFLLVLLGPLAFLTAWAQITPLGDPPPPHAAADQPLAWRLGAQWQHDDNVLRTPQAALADHIWVATAGVRLDQTYSLQRIELDAQVQGYRYQRASQLNFNALNYLAAWHWSLGRQWSGRLASERREYVDRFGDASVSSGLIRRTEAAQTAQVGYRLTQHWQALGGLFERRLDNTDPAGQEPDSSVRGADLGLRYQLPSDSTLAYRIRDGRGSYSGAAFAGGDFKEREHLLEISSLASAVLRLNGQLGQIDREHAQLSGRNFSGWTARVGALWELTGKTAVGAGWVRELAPFQTADASYYEGHRWYLAPQWQAGAKTLLRLRLEDGQRSYKGAPLGALRPGRQDRLQMVSLQAHWQATRLLQFSAMAQQDERRSDLGGADYRARIFAVSAQAGF